jgi:hypothetical protein
MDNSDAAMRRLLVGLVAVGLLTAAFLLWILPGVSTSQATVMWRGACGRVGAVMAALWLALPTGTRTSAWANLNPRSVAAVMIVGLAIRFPLRFLLPAAVVLMIAGAFLRPTPRPRPPREIDVDRN